MDLLSFAVGGPVVAVAMGVHVVAVAQDARQRAVHRRIVKHQAHVRDPGHEVVPGVALGLEEGLRLVPYVLMDLPGKLGLDHGVPVANEAPHLLVGKPDGSHIDLLNVLLMEC